MPVSRQFVNIFSLAVMSARRYPSAMSRKLLKSTLTVSGMTMISRLLGFVRDMVFAIVFGAGAEFDAFIIAFKFPNFMRRLFAEGAFSQAFVPVLSQYRAKHSPATLREFLNHLSGTLAIAVIVVVVVVEIIAPVVVTLFAPGFLRDPLRFAYASHMLRLTMPYLLFISITAFAAATLNTFKRFAAPAFTPILLNIVLIIVAGFWAPLATMPIYILAVGVLIAGVLQLLFLIPFLKHLNLLPRPKWGFRNQGVVRVLKLMVPALFGVSVAQISILIDNFFASFLQGGSISWLYYSDRLTNLPLGVIGVALSTVVLPNLSQLHQNASEHDYSMTIDWTLRIVLLIGIPAALGLYILAGPLIATLFFHRSFSINDVQMTRYSLCTFAVGLPFFMLVKILASVFYSRQNIKTPVKIAAVALVANIVLDFLLIHPLLHAGLALATSLTSLLNASFLFYFLLSRKIYQPQKGWFKLLLRIIFANLVMSIVIYAFSGQLKTWLQWDIWPRVWHLTLVVVLGVATYAISLFGSGLRYRHLKAPG